MRQPEASDGQERRVVFDTVVDRLDALLPKPDEWRFAVRIWIAMMLALGAAFWLQLDSASSAVTCVAILAQPRRGQVLAKAVYRLLGTLIGAAIAIVLMALFGQDRVLLLVGFTIWIGLCVFVAQYLQDFRAYGAMLSGYTVAIIAIQGIDAPQATFEAAAGRIAVITLGIAAITFVNDVLAAPGIFSTFVPKLTAAWTATRAWASEVLGNGDPGDERIAELLRSITLLRGDVTSIVGESADGRTRAAGARSCIAALYAMVASIRSAVAAASVLPKKSAAVVEALAICRRVAEAPTADALAHDDDRLRDLVDAAIREGRSADEVLALQRALDFVCAAIFALDGLEALKDAHVPLRDVKLQAHHDFALALRSSIRVAISFGLTAAAFVALGLPQASFALVLVASIAALSSTAPDANKFADGIVVGMALAAVLAGIARFGFLTSAQGFPVLAMVMAPVIFFGCFLSLNPKSASTGFILLAIFPSLLGPANPQSFDLQSFLLNAFLAVAATGMFSVMVRVVLPTTTGQRRVFALGSARRSMAEALAGEGGNATVRGSLYADRLNQFAGFSSGSSAVRRASLSHAFAMSRLEAAAARAHAELRRLWSVDPLRQPITRAQGALLVGNDAALVSAGNDLIRAGRFQDRGTRMTIARAVSDIVNAAQVIETHRRFLRRLNVTRF